MVQQQLLNNLTSCVKILEEKIGDVIKIGEKWDMIMEQLKALQHSFIEDGEKS